MSSTTNPIVGLVVGVLLIPLGWYVARYGGASMGPFGWLLLGVGVASTVGNGLLMLRARRR